MKRDKKTKKQTDTCIQLVSLTNKDKQITYVLCIALYENNNLIN